MHTAIVDDMPVHVPSPTWCSPLALSLPFSIVPSMLYLQQPNLFDVVPKMIDVVTNSTQTMPTCYILGRILLKSYRHHNVYIHVDNDYYNVVYCQNHWKQWVPVWKSLRKYTCAQCHANTSRYPRSTRCSRARVFTRAHTHSFITPQGIKALPG